MMAYQLSGVENGSGSGTVETTTRNSQSKADGCSGSKQEMQGRNWLFGGQKGTAGRFKDKKFTYRV